MMAAITPKLSVNGAAMNPKVAGNLLDRKSLFFEGTQYIPIVRGELSIFHKVVSLLGGRKNTLLSQFASLVKLDVALSM